MHKRVLFLFSTFRRFISRGQFSSDIREKRYAFYLCVVLMAVSLLTMPINTYSEDLSGYTNQETEYFSYIMDNADLFSDEEEDALYNYLFPISDWANVGIVTIDYNPYSDTEKYANEFLLSYFGDDVNAIVLVIDMDERVLTIWSDGQVRAAVESKSTIITDNIYTYASDGDYYSCAAIGMDQIYSVLNGEKIAQPMKYLSNACLAVLLALMMGYVIARKSSSTSAASKRETLNSIFANFTVKNPHVVHTHTTKEYSPRQSSSGGGGSGGGGGGGGGGSHGF